MVHIHHGGSAKSLEQLDEGNPQPNVVTIGG